MAKKLKDLNFCERVLREPGNRGRLANYYRLSQSIEQEVAAAVCEGKDKGVWTELLSSKGYRARGPMGGPEWVLEWEADENTCRGGRMIGHIHSHPLGSMIFSRDDLYVVNEEKVGCILYRKKKDLRMHCFERKGRKISDERLDAMTVEELNKKFQHICDRKVTSKGIRRYRLPWKKF